MSTGNEADVRPTVNHGGKVLGMIPEPAISLFDGKAHRDGFLMVHQGNPIHSARWIPGAG